MKRCIRVQAYLDNSATTPLCDTAKRWMEKAMDDIWGNPSSLHEVGLAAEMLLFDCRKAVADALHAKESELLFTSGGTEANNLALFGAATAKARDGKRILVSAVEHPSVMKAAEQLRNEGFDLQIIPVDKGGKVLLSALEELLTPETTLVSVMAVNNELGTIEPVAEIAALLRKKQSKALFHVDAVQAFGKLELSPKRIGCDLLTVSAHKIHGPKGAGALWVKPGVTLRPRTFGGEQQNGLRPGTEPTVAIAGFAGAATALKPAASLPRVTALRDAFVKSLRQMPEVRLNSAADALPYIVNLSLPGWPAETVLNFLSEKGVYVSSGSACAKGHRSPVLTAAGLDPALIGSSLRISLSDTTTGEELDYCLQQLQAAVRAIRRKG